MKPSASRIFRILTAAVLILVVCAACGQPLNSTPSQPTQPNAQTNPTGETVLPTAPSTQTEISTEAPSDDSLALQPDPLDHLLGLRSIQFSLTTQRPDGSTRTIEGEIDSAGNMHLKFTDPLYDTSGMPKDYPAVTAVPLSELFVLAGKAYLPDSDNPDWKTTPVDENFEVTFSEELHGLESPALWLNLLPAGSVSADGSEQVGGFSANRYKVAGLVSDATILGTLWKDPQSNALVQAELHVPAALLSSPDDPQPGEMVITLKANKANVKTITLP